MKKPLLSILLVAGMVAISSPASATPPSAVDIEVEQSLLGVPSPFVASGPAVDDGLMCKSGVALYVSSKVTGSSPAGSNFQGVNHFTCDDGSGEFLVNLQARLDFRKGDKFHWNVVGGTGDYANLHGAGSGVGLEICGTDCVYDIYQGGLHIDP